MSVHMKGVRVRDRVRVWGQGFGFWVLGLGFMV
jgi:hypothetical protein